MLHANGKLIPEQRKHAGAFRRLGPGAPKPAVPRGSGFTAAGFKACNCSACGTVNPGCSETSWGSGLKAICFENVAVLPLSKKPVIHQW